jgi:hypothetical protein
MNLLALLDRFASEEACRVWLEAARWSGGPVCPRCQVQRRASRLRTRPGQFTCLSCRHRYSLTSGTPLQDTKLSCGHSLPFGLPLRTWILAFCLISTSSKGVSARKLSEWLGVSYRSAWHLGHRVRALMASGEIRLSGVVEVDESYVSGRPRKVHKEKTLPRSERPVRKQGRATQKPCVFVAVERGGCVHAEVVASHTAGDLSGAVRRAAVPSAVLVSDELPAYRSVGREYVAHHTVCHSQDEFARTCEATGLRVHNNTAESFNAALKRAVVGVFPQLSRKHLARYAGEVAFRWNARRLTERAAGEVPACMHALFAAPAGPLPFRTLMAA